MNLERRPGQVGKQIAVEADYQRQHGTIKPYYQIAAEIYGLEFHTAEKVRQEILRRHGVEVSEKTASQWINRGLAEVTQADDPEPAEVAA